MDGLLNDPKNPVPIRTEPISDFYSVETRPFARGKFATVRRCCHLTSGLACAAKSMRKRRRAQDVRHEIVHEAHVLQLSAQHPHIVRLHEVYETPAEIVLVLELVPGGELQRVLDDEEVVPEREAARLLTQILSGVSFLHSHNIAHLDIKPQNLLLTKAFPEGEVKLCDFGISRLITKGADIREIVGTPDYVAPEILHYEPISLATDMWSIGILTYVLLSGHSPFGGDSKQETFCNITRGELDFPSDLFQNVSNHAKDFIRRLLVREPSERMTAEECFQHPWLSGTCTSPQGIELTLTSGTVPPPEPDNLNANSTQEPETHNQNQEVGHRNSTQNGTDKTCHIADKVTEPSVHNQNRQADCKNLNQTRVFEENTRWNSPFKGAIKKTFPTSESATKTDLEPGDVENREPESQILNQDVFTGEKLKRKTSFTGVTESGTRSVISKFEGLSKIVHVQEKGLSVSVASSQSMTKRIVFSEEIIVDERVGMVY